MPKVPFAVETLHHVAIPAHDFDALQRFYVRVPGFEAHPDSRIQRWSDRSIFLGADTRRTE